jgi:hypothetical protein
MWKNINSEKPTRRGHYYCFGTIYKGTEFEKQSKFSAYWQGDSFTDKDGDDFTHINESAEYWFDFSLIPTPL